ncbi:Ppx/GppA family phosphatase [Marinibaculum pumilum]|uniref:Ppx/GppA family phosphatase n=1 Tax=Marinibaculum pumilum TaxID=1766165 RepID=A0ABV7KW98_9PROT
MEDTVRMAERTLPDSLFVDGELAESAEDVARIGDVDVAVIDVGSNSVRLVVFSGPPGVSPAKLNEKVLCGLGRALRQTGGMDREAMDMAVVALRRFADLISLMGITEVLAVATAAVRDASNGPDFLQRVERECGLRLRVLSGEEEAALSAYGVLAGIPGADGLMGDLGGGSLELVTLNAGEIGAGVTLPLGTLRLDGFGTAGDLRDFIDSQLAKAELLQEKRGRPIYIVGGAWRAIARLQMAQTDYPLRIIHQYRIGRAEADATLRVLARQSKESLAGVDAVPRRRADSLPVAALVLRRLMRQVQPDGIVFCANGLREGLWYRAAHGAGDRQAADPLLHAARTLARGMSRDRASSTAIWRFVEPLLSDSPCGPGPAGPDLRRLERVVVILSDIAWRVHPDYRAQEAMNTMLHAPLPAVDHPGRVYVALAVGMRYGGDAEAARNPRLLALLPDDQRQRAVMLGMAIRLGYAIGGGAARPLAHFSLARDATTLTLSVAPGGEGLVGDVVERRLETLARQCGLAAEIRHLPPEPQAAAGD